MATEATEKKAKTPEEIVTMKDGRSVTFVGKRKVLKESFVNDETQEVSVRLDFRNGNTITWTIPDNLITKCAAHGAEQKLGDEYAGEEDVDDCQLAVEELIERLNKGEWAMTREGGGMSGTSVLARAIAELKGITIEQVKAFLKDKTQAQKTAMRGNEALKPIIARIEAEKVSKGPKIDTDALLATVPTGAPA